MFTNFTTQYLPPLLLVIIIALGGVLLLYTLSRRGIATRWWGLLVRYKGPLGFLFVTLLFVVAFTTFLVRMQNEKSFYEREKADLNTPFNLITNPLFEPGEADRSIPDSWVISGTVECCEDEGVLLHENAGLTSNTIVVQPAQSYRYSIFNASTFGTVPLDGIQIRFVWLDAGLRVLSWDDSPVLETGRYSTGAYKAPPGASRLQFEIRNVNMDRMIVREPKLSQEGVYVESHPNATSGSIAFSFDWETAMGGAVHSKGDEIHDVTGAEQHGMEMREGAEWLNNLFVDNSIHATFYATGYNLIDGNTDKKTFNGDPTYTWASPKDGWASEYWLTHPWFGDDPFGTYQSNPAWYFGDQTRTLLAAGHEVAPHTFAHIYVRGSNPEELATDLDEWIKYAKEAGVVASIGL